MNQTSLSFTVFFEDPYWIGLFEYREQQQLYLKRIVFGSEPGEQMVYEWLKRYWYSISFQTPVETVRQKASHQNPKRRQREARRAQDTRLSLTKSQLAVKQQQEERAEQKAERRKENRAIQKEAFRLRQMKKKAKHKGR